MSVVRYNPERDGCLVVVTDGDYVKFSDYERMKRRLESAVDALRAFEPLLTTEAELLDNASLNDGRASEWDMACQKARRVLRDEQNAGTR